MSMKMFTSSDKACHCLNLCVLSVIAMFHNLEGQRAPQFEWFTRFQNIWQINIPHNKTSKHSFESCIKWLILCSRPYETYRIRLILKHAILWITKKEQWSKTLFLCQHPTFMAIKAWIEKYPNYILFIYVFTHEPSYKPFAKLNNQNP